MHYIVMQRILDLCERSAQRPVAWVSWHWWEQDGLYLERVKKRAAEERRVIMTGLQW